MPKGKRVAAEEVVSKLRLAEVELAKGISIEEVCKKLQISTQSFYRWRKEYGGLEIDQAKRLKDLERENARLKRLVADQALDNAMLRDIASGNF
jgi:putative transposase